MSARRGLDDKTDSSKVKMSADDNDARKGSSKNIPNSVAGDTVRGKAPAMTALQVGQAARQFFIGLDATVTDELAEQFSSQRVREFDFLAQCTSPFVVTASNLQPDTSGISEDTSGEHLVPYLSAYARDKPLSRFAWSHIAYELLCALECLEAHGVVHGNLCMENLYLSRDFHVKLGGFFSPNRLEALHRVPAAAQRFHAPERIAGGAATAASDRYSFGVLLLDLALGIPEPAPVSRINEEPIHMSLHLLSHRMPFALPLIRGCLETDPAARWTLRQMRAWLPDDTHEGWVDLLEAAVKSTPLAVARIMTALRATVQTPPPDPATGMPVLMLTAWSAVVGLFGDHKKTNLSKNQLMLFASALILDAGILETILDAMRAHPTHIPLLVTAMVLLRSLLVVNGTFMEQAWQAGVPEAVIKLVRRLPDEVPVQHTGADLFALFGSGFGRKHAGDSNTKPFVEMIHLVRYSMLRHATVPTAPHDFVVSAIRCFPIFARSEILHHDMTKAGVIDAMVTVMRAHPANETVHQLAISFFESYSKSYMTLLAGGILEVIMADMVAFPHSVTVLRPACIALHAIAGHDPTAREAAQKAGVVQALVRVVQENMGESLVLSVAVHALDHIARGISEVLVASSVVETVLTMMRQHPGEIGLLQVAAETLRNLMVGELKQETMALLRAPDAVRLFTQSARQYPEAVRLVEHSIGCLGFAANGASTAELEVLREFDAMSFVETAMAQFEDDEDMQETCCMALCYLAELDAHKQAVLDEADEAIERVIIAMQGFPDNGDLQEYACMFITAIGKTRRAGDTFMGMDGGEAILETLRHLVDNEEVVARAAYAIRMLASDVAVGAQLYEMGAGQVLVEALLKHCDGEGDHVRFNALEALGKMLRRMDDHDEALSISAMQAVLRVMRAHPTKKAILSAGLDCLARLAFHDENAEPIVAAGGLAVIGDAMRAFVQSGSLQVNGCVVLGHIAYTEAAAVVDARMVTLVVTAMTAHPDEVELQGYGCDALAFIGRTIALPPAIIQVITTALRTHVENETLTTAACSALKYFACSEEGRAKLSQPDVISSVLNVFYNQGSSVQARLVLLYAFDNHSKAMLGAVDDAWSISDGEDGEGEDDDGGEEGEWEEGDEEGE